MGRVALVTGGTRGIGAAIAKALKKAGYNVAVNYGGNDAAAQAFKKETNIPVFKWDVGDYVACGPSMSRTRSGPSKCWSTMPASRATPCCRR
jgi:acetoacetyl-CoA reductase